jgi:hypothetical protein
MRLSSYVVITTRVPEAQVIVHDFWGEALYLISPPQENTFLTTTGKKALRAHEDGETLIPNLKSVKRIVFDQNWRNSLAQGFIDILELDERGSQDVLPDENVQIEEIPPAPKSNQISARRIIELFKQNPQGTAQAIREAVKAAYDPKKAKEVTKTDLRDGNKQLIITLPPQKGQDQGETVTIYAKSLEFAFRQDENIPSLLFVLGNPESLVTTQPPYNDTKH